MNGSFPEFCKLCEILEVSFMNLPCMELVGSELGWPDGKAKTSIKT